MKRARAPSLARGLRGRRRIAIAIAPVPWTTMNADDAGPRQPRREIAIQPRNGIHPRKQTRRETIRNALHPQHQAGYSVPPHVSRRSRNRPFT